MGIKNLCWRVFDNVVLLQMGQTYQNRLQEFMLVAEGEQGLRQVEEWRKDQQAEWDRLSTTVRRNNIVHHQRARPTPDILWL